MSARARHTDPDTSHAAAASVNLTRNQQSLMMVFRIVGEPMLDEEMIAAYEHWSKPMGLPQQSESGLRSRRSELEKTGKLVADGKKKMSTGRMGRTFKVNTEEAT